MPEATSQSGTLADVNAAGRHYMTKVVNELLLLRHAAATHLRYQESVEECLRRGDTDAALGVLKQQRANLRVAIERTGALIDGKYADLYLCHFGDDSGVALDAAREQAQP